jgi:hypothetical protein
VAVAAERRREGISGPEGLGCTPLPPPLPPPPLLLLPPPTASTRHGSGDGDSARRGYAAGRAGRRGRLRGPRPHGPHPHQIFSHVISVFPLDSTSLKQLNSLALQRIQRPTVRRSFEHRPDLGTVLEINSIAGFNLCKECLYDFASIVLFFHPATKVAKISGELRLKNSRAKKLFKRRIPGFSHYV